MRRAVWLAVMAFVLPTLAGAQSLGEVAKKEKERRKKNASQPEAVRQLTKKDLEAARRPEPIDDESTSEVSTAESVANPSPSEAVESPPGAGPASATRAPSFSLEDRGGRRVSLSDFRGRPVLIDFWATWCGPCRATMPKVEQLHRRYRGLGLQVIGINIEGRTPEVLGYVDEGGYTFLVLFDEGNWKSNAALSYGVRSIPRSFLIDRSGNLVFSGHPDRLRDDLIESVVR